MKWETLNKPDYSEVKEGDVRIVTLPIKVICEWSDNIPVDFDEDGKPIEFKSGIIMKPLYDQWTVYQNQETIFLYQTTKK